MSSSVMGIHRRPSHSPQIGLKNARLQPPTGTQDLIVIGLDEHTTNDDLRFTFRGLVLAQVKRHQESGHCKGYAFIRFNRLDEELRCLTQRSFKIRGRLCNVKRPDSQTSDLPPVRPPAAAPLPAAAASLPPAASIPPTEVGLIQPTKECTTKDVVENVTRPIPPPPPTAPPSPLACMSKEVDESVTCPTPPPPSPLARDSREANRNQSSMSLPHDFQVRLFINPKVPPFEVRDYSANERLMKELGEFFTKPKPGHLPETLFNAMCPQHKTAAAAGSSYSRSTAELSASRNAEGTSGGEDFKQQANESGKQLSSLTIRHDDVCVHARGYLFVTLKFWFNWTDPNNSASNSERDTANGSSISSSNSHTDRAVGLLKESIENLFFKGPYLFQGIELHIALARSRNPRSGVYPGFIREGCSWKQPDTSPFPLRFAWGFENGERKRLGNYGIQMRTELRGLSRSSNEGSTPAPPVPTKATEDPTITPISKPNGAATSPSSVASLTSTSPLPLLPAPRPTAPNLPPSLPLAVHLPPAYTSLSLPQQPQLLTSNPLLANVGINGNNLNLTALNGIHPTALQQLLCQQALMSTPTPVPSPAVSPDVLNVVASLSGLQNALPLNQLLALQMLALNANGAGSGYLPIAVQYSPRVQYPSLNAPLLSPMAAGLNGVQYANGPCAQYTGYPVLPAEYSIAMAQMAGVGQPMQLLCDASQANSLSSMPALGAVPSLLPNGTQSPNSTLAGAGEFGCLPQASVTQPVLVNVNAVPSVSLAPALYLHSG